MKWTIKPTTKLEKQISALPKGIQAAVQLLLEELELEGPMQPEWPNYGKLKGLKGVKKTDARYHCHLQRGKPTYVACWRLDDNSHEKQIEVYYVGTHEKAPY
jgi:mRNA-degrading endonuclease RelE of RelBE toxin-antitoxin system